MRKYTVNDFFCGAGGVALGFKEAGFDVIWACDFDKHCVTTYSHNVGEWVQQLDVTKITYKDIPKADGWAFGFPCQDLSVAGQQAGFVMKCNDCNEEFKITAGTQAADIVCPKCGGGNISAATRSACFFEIMRLLDETRANAPENYPSFLLAENVKGLRPYIPTLKEQLEMRGFDVHIQLYNSKYWNVPQNRERYFIVATPKDKGAFAFPEEQHEYVPKLSSALDKVVDEKYYIPDEKAQTIILQALQKIEKLGNAHACITPDRLNKRQNGPRAKTDETEMFTLTAQDIHGIIVQERNGVSRDAMKYISDKLLEFVEKHGYIPKFFNPYNCSDCGELAPTATTACGGLTTSATVLVFTDKNSGEPVTIQLPRGKNDGNMHTVAPTLTANAYEQNNFVCENAEPFESVVCNESGLLDPEGQGKTLRVGGGVADKETQLSAHFSEAVRSGVCKKQRNGKGTFVGVSPTLIATDYKGPHLVIEEAKSNVIVETKEGESE